MKAIFARIFLVWWVLFVCFNEPLRVAAASEEFIASANEGQLFASQKVWNFSLPAEDQASMPNDSPSWFYEFDADGNIVGIKNTLYTQELFPGYTGSGQNAHLEGLANDPAAMGGIAANNNANLELGSDSYSEAYGMLNDAANNVNSANVRQSIESDPLWDQTYSILDGTDPILDDVITGCVTTTEDTTVVDDSYEYTNVLSCSQAYTPSFESCTATRNVSLVPVETKVIYEVIYVSGGIDLSTLPGGSGSSSGSGSTSWTCEEPAYSQCLNRVNTCPEYPEPRNYMCEEIRDEEILNCRAAHCSPDWDSSGFGLYGDYTFMHNPTTKVFEQDVAIGQYSGVANVNKYDFNPSAHGLLIGEWLVGNFRIVDPTGSRIQNPTLMNAGNKLSNFTFTYNLFLNGSPGFQLEATLYRVEVNDMSAGTCDNKEVSSLVDGYCVGTAVCTDYTNCRTVDGVEICDSGATVGYSELLTSWGAAGGDPSPLQQMCWTADITRTACGFEQDCSGGQCNNGEGFACWETAACEYPDDIDQSECQQVCADLGPLDWTNNLNEVDHVDNCEDLIANPNCTLLEERDCNVDYLGDETDECYLERVMFSCAGQGTNLPPQYDEGEEYTICEGSIGCIGDECVNLADEDNPDFAQAAAMGGLINFMQQDFSCSDTNDPETCQVFEGSNETCQNPVNLGTTLGVPNCCKIGREMAAQNTDMAAYLELLTYMYTAATSPYMAEYTSAFMYESGMVDLYNSGAGAVESVGTAFQSGWNSVMQWMGFDWAEISIDWSSMLLETSVEASAQTAGWTGVTQWVGQAAYDVMGEELGQEFFQTNTEGAVSGWANDGIGAAMEAVAEVLNTVMFIYTIYKITTIIIGMLYECEDSDLNFGIKVAMKSCHYVGKWCEKELITQFGKKCVIERESHCCYASPLARIIQEQIKGASVPFDERGTYNGPEWGNDIRNPSCGGISIQELQNVDWNNVDLSEWIAIMEEAGFIPSADEIFNRPDYTSAIGGGGADDSGEGVDAVNNNVDALSYSRGAIDQLRRDLKEGVHQIGQYTHETMPWYAPPPAYHTGTVPSGG